MSNPDFHIDRNRPKRYATRFRPRGFGAYGIAVTLREVEALGNVQPQSARKMPSTDQHFTS